MSTREPSAPPAASVAEARMVEEKGDLIEFTYGWPAEAAAIPALDARLEADLTKQRDEARAMAREDKDARSPDAPRSEEHKSALQSLMRISSAVLGLNTTKHN